MHLALHLLRLVRALVADRTRLAIENLVLRQQLTVLQRSVERPKLNDGDRAFWTMACEFLENWKEHLVIVKPDTASVGDTTSSRPCAPPGHASGHRFEP